MSGEGSDPPCSLFAILDKNEAWLLPIKKPWISAEIGFPGLCALQDRDAKGRWISVGRGMQPRLMSPPQVAQYIKFEMPVLKSFIQKLQEEEDREVKKLMRK